MPGRAVYRKLARSVLRVLRSTIGVRRQASDAVKEPGEMALVCAAHGKRDLDDRQIGLLEEFPGPLDAAADHVLVRRNADGRPEHVREVVRADPKRVGDVRQREVVIEVTVDERKRLLDPWP